MNFSISKSVLLQATDLVGKVTRGRQIMPILGTILLRANEDGTTSLSGTNLTTTIKQTVPATVNIAGAACVPASLLSEVLGNMPDQAITLKLSPGGTLSLECDRIKTKIKCLLADDFPQVITPDPITTLTFTGAELAALANRLAPFCARGTDRPVLGGVNVRVIDGRRWWFSSTGYQTSVIDSGPATETLNAIIPGGVFELLPRAEHFSLHLNANNAVFSCGDTVVITQLIAGNYPNILNFIPTEFAQQVEVDANRLRHALQTVMPFAKDETLWSFGAHGLNLSAQSAEMGDSEIMLEVGHVKEHMTICLNGSFALEAIKQFRGAVRISFTDARGLVQFSQAEDESFRHLMSPIYRGE